MINLSIEPKDGVFQLMHPVTDKPMDLTLTMVGTNSKEFYDAITELSQTSSEFDMNTNMDLVIARCVTGWSGKEVEGTEFSPEEILSLISDKRHIWVLNQLKMFFMDQTNFFSSEE